MEHAVVVDASSAYLAAASEEAARRERSSSTQFVHGDFLTVAGDLAPATVVTLDRVVCCYPAYRPLLEKSLARAEHGLRTLISEGSLVRQIRDVVRERLEAPARESG
jgi:hypothetical protein